MPAGPQLGTALAKAVARIEKEIERYERAPATMRIGGITQVAKVVEVVMKAALCELCAVRRLDPQAVLLNHTHARSLSKATLGHLMEAVKVTTSKGRTAASLQRDLRRRGSSALWAFLDIRNQGVVHAGQPEPTPQVMLPVLRDLLRLMRAAERDCT